MQVAPGMETFLCAAANVYFRLKRTLSVRVRAKFNLYSTSCRCLSRSWGSTGSCRPNTIVWGDDERTSTLANAENVTYSGHSSPRQSVTHVPDNQPAVRIGPKDFLGGNAHFIRNLTCIKSKCAESVGREARGRAAQRLCISGFMNEQKVFDEPLTLVRVIVRQWLTLDTHGCFGLGSKNRYVGCSYIALRISASGGLDRRRPPGRYLDFLIGPFSSHR
jgi:hypothetical protein